MGFVSRALFVTGHKTLERQRGTPSGAERFYIVDNIVFYGQFV